MRILRRTCTRIYAMLLLCLFVDVNPIAHHVRTKRIFDVFRTMMRSCRHGVSLTEEHFTFSF